MSTGLFLTTIRNSVQGKCNSFIMPDHNYLYSFNYDYHLHEICKLESRQIFSSEIKDKLLFSDIQVDPSISAFIKNRLDIISSSKDFNDLLETIKGKDLRLNGFNVEYISLNGDTTDRSERRKKIKAIGYCIYGYPEFKAPSVTYATCQYAGLWYFGILTKHENDWYKHKKKPHSFSNSIDMEIAKTLVSIASKGDKTNTLLDACCGVGTVLLEAYCAGFSIAGCDISPKAAKYSRLNLAHYQYNARVYCTDIEDHPITYDAAIIDLPYNIYAVSDEETTRNIIHSSAKLVSRLVIVSIVDIQTIIEDAGLKIHDTCSVIKKGKSTFKRKVWVCEKEA